MGNTDFARNKIDHDRAHRNEAARINHEGHDDANNSPHDSDRRSHGEEKHVRKEKRISMKYRMATALVGVVAIVITFSLANSAKAAKANRPDSAADFKVNNFGFGTFNRNNERNIVRDADRNADRNVDREFDSTIDRSVDNNIDRNVDRSVDGNVDRDIDRDNEFNTKLSRGRENQLINLGLDIDRNQNSFNVDELEVERRPVFVELYGLDRF